MSLTTQRIQYQAEYLDDEVERLDECLDLLNGENLPKARLALERYREARDELRAAVETAESGDTESTEPLATARDTLQERFRDLEQILSAGAEECVEETSNSADPTPTAPPVSNELRRARMMVRHVERRHERLGSNSDSVHEMKTMLRELEAELRSGGNADQLKPQLRKLWARIADAARALRAESPAG